MPFSKLWRKINCAHSLSTYCSHAHILSKNAHSSKNTLLTSHFFLMFHEKPPADMPIFNLKNVNSVKTILNYGPKKSVEYHYFPIFHEKINALMSILCQKNINFLKKYPLSSPYFVKKSVLPLKNMVFSFHFCQLSCENLFLSYP